MLETKVMTLLTIFVSVVVVSHCSSINGDNNIEKYISRKCELNNGDKYFMRNNFLLINSCLTVYVNLKSSEDLYTHVCEKFGEYTCSEKLLTEFSKCLVQEEMYLTDFILSNKNKTTDQACGSKEAFISNADTFVNSACVKNNKFLHTCKSCFKKLNLNFNDDLVFTKPLVCGLLQEWKNCMEKHLLEHCETNELELVRNGLETFLYNCNSDKL